MLPLGDNSKDTRRLVDYCNFRLIRRSRTISSLEEGCSRCRRELILSCAAVYCLYHFVSLAALNVG